LNEPQKHKKVQWLNRSTWPSNTKDGINYGDYILRTPMHLYLFFSIKNSPSHC